MSCFYDHLKKDLNQAQQDAVFFKTGPLLLIAGAGSGKTKTLVHRVARLIEDGVPPEQILLLTFTRKASEEMLQRASHLLDARCSHVSGGTFHAFANTALRKYAPAIGFDPNFNILDRGDCEDIVQTQRKAISHLAKEKRFPKKGTITSILSKAVNTSTAIAKIIEADYASFIEFTPEIERIAQGYTSQKKAMNVMDYDDLLTYFLACLEQKPDIREQFQRYYHYILVDEYQDTNSIQARLVLAVTNPAENIMVVGDDAQSIYSFRGAHHENIIQFPTLFPNATVIKLEQNYRSTQPILDLTNAVIGQAQNQFNKTLFTENTGGNKPKIVETGSENEQSQFICKTILEIHEKQHIPLSKIAVLIRSGWHSNDLELELKSRQIPFVKMGGFKFIETSHVKDVIAYCKLIYNPMDSLSWQRVLLLMQGCGPSACSTIIRTIQSNLSQIGTLAPSFKGKKYSDALCSLLELITNSDPATISPKTLLEQVFITYNPLFKLKYDDFSKRKSDIDSLIAISERFTTVEDMLANMSLDPPRDSYSESNTPPSDKDNDSICLSTIHSAKGLEWHTVFLLSALDGYLPSFQSLGDPAQVEEERRLMYVALTRAEQTLYILKPNIDTAQNYMFSGMTFSKISRFLDTEQIKTTLTESSHPPVKKKKSNFSLPLDDDLIAPSQAPYKKKKPQFYL